MRNILGFTCNSQYSTVYTCAKFQDYDINVDMSVAPTTIQKGNGDLFMVTFFITEPAAPFEFSVKQPLGYEVWGIRDTVLHLF